MNMFLFRDTADKEFPASNILNFIEEEIASLAYCIRIKVLINPEKEG